jgi:putative N-acetylmannosamine-6-phosphate epimerase
LLTYSCQAIRDANMAAADIVVAAIDAYEEAKADSSRAADLPAVSFALPSYHL